MAKALMKPGSKKLRAMSDPLRKTVRTKPVRLAPVHPTPMEPVPNFTAGLTAWPFPDPEPPTRSPAAVGDLNSNAAGTGARFNEGKPDYSLVPLKLMGETLMRVHPTGPAHVAARAIFLLGCYQSSRDIAVLYAIIEELGAQEGWLESARVFEYGKRKYAAWNWAKGMPWSVPLACAVRHLLAMLAGEQMDAESGLPHRGHVFCNLSMLITYAVTYRDGDDFAATGRLA